MKHLIAFISILMLITVAVATPVSVTIWGDGKSQAATNYTFTTTGANNSLNVLTWNLTYGKTWMLNSSNASGDVVTFNISNITAYRMVELKVNGTVINGYQATANGMVNFTYNSLSTSNKTYSIAPASNIASGNQTWVKTWNGAGITVQDVNMSFAVNTVYQNKNNTAMLNTVAALGAAGGSIACTAKVGTTNPPTDVVAQWDSQVADGLASATFYVPVDYYFMVAQEQTCTLTRWTVWR